MGSYQDFNIGKGLLEYGGNIMADGFVISKKVAVRKRTIGAEITTSGNVQYTPAQLFSGLIIRDPGAARADKVPSAVDLVASMGDDAFVGASFEFVIRNTANGAEEITLTLDDGDTTMSGTMTIGRYDTKRFLVVVTNIDSASEAYTTYSLGTLVY